MTSHSSVFSGQVLYKMVLKGETTRMRLLERASEWLGETEWVNEWRREWMREWLTKWQGEWVAEWLSDWEIQMGRACEAVSGYEQKWQSVRTYQIRFSIGTGSGRRGNRFASVIANCFSCGINSGKCRTLTTARRHCFRLCQRWVDTRLIHTHLTHVLQTKFKLYQRVFYTLVHLLIFSKI